MPSFWTGVAAGTYPFKNLIDYSRWAFGLLEAGHDGPAIRILAGLDQEGNLFVLREWHRKALKDLGRELPSEHDAFLCYLRGLAEEYLVGSKDFHETLEIFSDLYLDSRDPRLDPFYTLNLAWFHYDEANWGLGPKVGIPGLFRDRCSEMVRTLQALEETRE